MTKPCRSDLARRCRGTAAMLGVSSRSDASSQAQAMLREAAELIDKLERGPWLVDAAANVKEVPRAMEVDLRAALARIAALEKGMRQMAVQTDIEWARKIAAELLEGRDEQGTDYAGDGPQGSGGAGG